MGLKIVWMALLLTLPAWKAQAQLKYDLFEMKGDELIWQNVYAYPGQPDSLRPAVVKMLKSKFFTFNVIRNEKGYNGEIKHYPVHAKRYGRTYLNTPRMYWEGEWTGKFIVELAEGSYRVTVYALYYDAEEKSNDYYKTQKPVHGRLVDVVTTKNKEKFRKSEMQNLALMSISLKDQFDIANTGRIED